MRRNVIDRYDRETVDFIPLVDVVIEGVAYTDAADLEVAITPEFVRPTTWVAATDGDGQPGFILNGPTLGRGVFAVRVRPAAGPIQPVILVGHIRLS